MAAEEKRRATTMVESRGKLIDRHENEVSNFYDSVRLTRISTLALDHNTINKDSHKYNQVQLYAGVRQSVLRFKRLDGFSVRG